MATLSGVCCLISEAKDKLQTEISVMRDIMADPEKNQGRLSREDKVRCLNKNNNKALLPYSTCINCMINWNVVWC